jgi:hypothetical protein
MQPLITVRSIAIAAASILLVACGSSRGPVTRPAPVAAPPVTNLPPVVQPQTPAPAARAFAYASGEYRYEVRNEATIAAVGGDARTDTVVTRAIIALRLQRLPSDSIEVQGSIDTFTVAGGRGAPVPPLAQPVPFRFLLAPSGASAPWGVDSASACGAPMSTLLVVAHDLLPPVHVPLADGAEWQDSTVSATCRAMIPVTSRAERTARAAWVVVPSEIATVQGQVGYRILRTSSGIISGEGQAAGRQVLLTGTTSTTSAVYLNPTSGMLHGGVGDAVTRLIVDTGTQRQEFIQQLRQHIHLLH